jgi:hypothetical protein
MVGPRNIYQKPAQISLAPSAWLASAKNNTYFHKNHTISMRPLMITHSSGLGNNCMYSVLKIRPNNLSFSV